MLQGVFQIARGEFVLFIVTGNGDDHAIGQLYQLVEVCFARRGKQLGWLHLRRRKNREQATRNREKKTRKNMAWTEARQRLPSYRFQLKLNDRALEIDATIVD